MPTVIAIEAKRLDFRGIDSGYFHLYLVKTVTDTQGRVLSEKVIRGTAESDGSLGTLANVELSDSPDRRGSDTPQERHRTVLDLNGRSAEDVWKVMVQHAVNIDKAHLPYSADILQRFDGDDVNSNSVVASVMHSVGIDWSTHYPIGISRSDVPLYGQLSFMEVNETLYGTARGDVIFGGVGHDNLFGGGQNDKLVGESGNDKLYGAYGNDELIGGSGDDRLYGEYGRDILRGGSGKDAFVFKTAIDGTDNLDSLWDFSVADDTILLDNKIFKTAGPEGQLKSWAFWKGTAAHDASDRVIYDSAHGVLYYDPDGIGAAQQIAITRLTKDLKMTAADFLIV